MEQFVLFSAFIIALFFLQKFARPVLKNQLLRRRASIITERSLFQKNLKVVRSSYEHANIFYFENFEKKVKWMNDAEDLFVQKLNQLKIKHEAMKKDIEYQYLIRKQKIEGSFKEIFIQTLMNEFEERLLNSVNTIDLSKLIDK